MKMMAKMLRSMLGLIRVNINDRSEEEDSDSSSEEDVKLIDIAMEAKAACRKRKFESGHRVTASRKRKIESGRRVAGTGIEKKVIYRHNVKINYSNETRNLTMDQTGTLLHGELALAKLIPQQIQIEKWVDWTQKWKFIQACLKESSSSRVVGLRMPSQGPFRVIFKKKRAGFFQTNGREGYVFGPSGVKGGWKTKLQRLIGSTIADEECLVFLIFKSKINSGKFHHMRSILQKKMSTP